MACRPASQHDVAAAPLLKGLPPALIDRLTPSAKLVQCEAADLLFEEGQTPSCLFILRRGAVELFVAADAREPAVAIVWPPEALVPAAMLSGRPYLVSGRALCRCELLSLDAAAVRQAARDDGDLACRFTSLLCGQYRTLQRHMTEMRLREAPQRLAAFLYRLVRTQGANGFADLPMPKRRLAARLGIAPESVSRSLKVLRENGIEVRASRVILRDRARLERFCAPDPLIDGTEADLLATAL